MAYKPNRSGRPAYRDRNEKPAGRRESRRDTREIGARRERTAEVAPRNQYRDFEYKPAERPVRAEKAEQENAEVDEGLEEEIAKKQPGN